MRLIDVDELRKELGFSDTCDNCERVTSHCTSDNSYSLYDFCVKLDCAIEAILEKHKDSIDAFMKDGERMDRATVMSWLEGLADDDWRECYSDSEVQETARQALDLIDELLKEQEEERRRMISWLGKFCRHIDNGDKWLSDEENIAFFREKMKQQFGWDF